MGRTGRAVKPLSFLSKIWENYLILEHLKRNLNQPFPPRSFFWRTMIPQNHEIDYLEEAQGQLHAWEIRLKPRGRTKIPPSFLKAYTNAGTDIVTPDNFAEFLLD